MAQTMPMLVLLTLGTALASCGNYTGSWPKLGPTTRDASAAVTTADTMAAPVVALDGVLGPEARGTLDAINTRLALVATSYTDLERRATMQMRSVSAAMSKVGDRASTGWSLAQLELSRLSQIETELRTVRSDAAGVAADLASFSAKGLDVSQSVAQTGTLINAIDTVLVEADDVRQMARNRLSS
ncbi:MAG: hypothetical protein AAF221_07620 [Pseudomonadota bacterium]